MIRPVSIRTRLTLWYAGSLALVLVVYAVAVLLFLRQRLYQALDERLHEDKEVVEQLLQHGVDGAWRLASDGHGDGTALGFVTIVQSPGGALLCASPAGEERRWSPSAEWRETRSLVGGGEPLRVASDAETCVGQPVVIHVARSELPLQHELKELLLVQLVMLPIAVLLCGAGGYLLARRMLAPLGRMADRAREISAERLDERLPIAHARDELGNLATVFNDTLGRLQRSFEQLKRFTADASHELRTPLTALRSVGEVGLRTERDPAEYREIIGSMLEEADRLTRLIDSLLLLARSDSGALTLARERIELGDLASAAAAGLQVLAEERGQSFAVIVKDPVFVAADRNLLRQVLINLIDNAIKHSPDGGTIEIEVDQQDGTARCAIRDSGPGIAPEHQMRIFERFYRVDDARARATGGTGLGLAIARAVVELHGGTIVLARGRERGSEFRIELPLAKVGALGPG